MSTAPGLITIAIVVTLVAIPCVSPASWLPDGAPVCEWPGEQEQPGVVADGAGGMIVAWADDRGGSGFALYAQRLDGSGAPYWVHNGILIGEIYGPQMRLGATIPDAGHGAIVAWYSADESDIFVHHVDENGAQAWGTSGTRVDSDGDAITEIAAIPDGTGGMFLAWQADTGSDSQVMVQRIDAAGNEVWTPGGFQVFNTSATQLTHPSIVADGSGGFFIAARINDQIYCQRVYGSGAAWSIFPRLSFHAETDNWLNPVIANDGTGGVYVALEYDDSSSSRIFVQRIGADGTVLWPALVDPCNSPANEVSPDLTSDAYGNAVVVWRDDRIGYSDIYAQKISPSGIAMWTAAGLPIAAADWSLFEPRLLAGPGTNLLVAYHDDSDVHARMIDVAGGSVWGLDGVEVVPGLAGGGYDVAPDGMGGVIATVVDRRIDSTFDIYAGAVNSLGQAYVSPFIVGVDDIAGDQGGWVQITVGRCNRDDLDMAEKPIARYDVWRGIPAPAARTPGAGTLSDGKTGRPVAAAPMAVIPAGYWERLGSFAATQELEYFFAAPTLADSSQAGPSWTTYFVSAHTTDPQVWFASMPDSGYSVDNIPPGVPVGITAAYGTGGVDLAWDPAPEPDFQYHRIYRGTDPAFVPSPANLAHETAEAFWSDPTAEPWDHHYKITTLDHAGNESPAGSPTGVSGAPEGAVPPRTTLLGAVPNPFNPATRLSFAIREPGRVRLRVFDPAGRSIATLVDGHRGAGSHHVTWDGRDDSGRMVASGVYFYRMEAPTYRQTKPMVLVR